MKRTLALILAVFMLLSLVACGGREGKDMSKVTSLSDLEGTVLAAQSGTFHIQALQEQVKNAETKDYEDFPALLIALNSGAIDGYVAEEPTAYAECLKDSSLAYVPLVNNSTGFTATAADTGIAVAFKTGSDMVAKVNAVIATISGETRTALMEQAVRMSNDKEGKNPETLVLVSDKTDTSNGTLKIAMECGYDPFNWKQTTDVNGAVAIHGGNGFYANGYDVQIAKYIAAELGMALEIHQLEWGALIPAVQAGTVDGIIAGMSPTAEREEEVDFTECYYNSNLVIVYKKVS